MTITFTLCALILQLHKLTYTDLYKQQQGNQFLSINNPSKTANENISTHGFVQSHTPASLASTGGQYDPITAVDADQHENQKKTTPDPEGKFYE